MALTKERDTVRRGPVFNTSYGVLAGAKIYKGALVVLTAAGYAAPGSVATTLKAVGRATETVDNTAGASAAVQVPVEAGVFRWANHGTHTATIANITGNAYVVDDETVANTDGTSTRSVAGIIVDVDANGVWVRTGLKS